MNKEKQIKFFLVSITIFIIVIALLHDLNCYQSKVLLCDLSLKYSIIFESLSWFSLPFLFVIIITFFISDKIFKKWLIFTPFYLFLTAFLVYKAPVSAGGALGIGPTKELVSIWMGILFVIISIIMFIWMSFKEKKNR